MKHAKIVIMLTITRCFGQFTNWVTRESRIVTQYAPEGSLMVHTPESK